MNHRETCPSVGRLDGWLVVPLDGPLVGGKLGFHAPIGELDDYSRELRRADGRDVEVA